MCPDDGDPPGVPDAPARWNCNNGQKRCTLQCAGIDACDGSTQDIDCPPGWECVVECSGISSCKANTINCGDYPCTVACTGVDSCQDTIINCSNATCNVLCDGVASVCSGNMEVNCQAGYRCNMDCEGLATAPPTVNNCQAACECNEC